MALTAACSGAGGINVTPLIDVLLVLLVIFMVITPVQSVGLEAAVPQPPPDTPTSRLNPPVVVVQIDRTLTVTVNSQPTNMESLGARLLDIFRHRAERVLFVKADPDVEFRHVARAIDIAKGAGIDRVGLLSGPVPNPPTAHRNTLELHRAAV
jgi:biopolymer transport protein ExbD